MNLLDTLMAASRTGGLQQAAASQGIAADALPALLKSLVPALASGMQKNVSGQNGLESLASALARGNHGRYLSDAAALSHADAVSDGNGILGHLLGSKDVSRALAARAAGSTGIDPATIKRFLPIVASALMAALSQRTQGGAQLRGASAGGLGGLLGGLVDKSGDGVGLDDLMSLGKSLFR